MPIHAQMVDGTILEFPDGTDDAVVDKAVQKYLSTSFPNFDYNGAKKAGYSNDEIIKYLSSLSGTPKKWVIKKFLTPRKIWLFTR